MKYREYRESGKLLGWGFWIVLAWIIRSHTFHLHRKGLFKFFSSCPTVRLSKALKMKWETEDAAKTKLNSC